MEKIFGLYSNKNSITYLIQPNQYLNYGLKLFLTNNQLSRISLDKLEITDAGENVEEEERIFFNERLNILNNLENFTTIEESKKHTNLIYSYYRKEGDYILITGPIFVGYLVKMKDKVKKQDDLNLQYREDYSSFKDGKDIEHTKVYINTEGEYEYIDEDDDNLEQKRKLYKSQQLKIPIWKLSDNINRIASPYHPAPFYRGFPHCYEIVTIDEEFDNIDYDNKEVKDKKSLQKHFYF